MPSLWNLSTWRAVRYSYWRGGCLLPLWSRWTSWMGAIDGKYMEAFIHRKFLHTEAFTQKPLHSKPSRGEALAKLLHAASFHTENLWHTEAFTHSKLFHAESTRLSRLTLEVQRLMAYADWRGSPAQPAAMEGSIEPFASICVNSFEWFMDRKTIRTNLWPYPCFQSVLGMQPGKRPSTLLLFSPPQSRGNTCEPN